MIDERILMKPQFLLLLRRLLFLTALGMCVLVGMHIAKNRTDLLTFDVLIGVIMLGVYAYLKPKVKAVPFE
jgi:hypothetical protein